jgi:hypothetical protein
LTRERALGGLRRLDGVVGSGKRDEKRVALRVDHLPALAVEGLAQDAVVLAQGFCVTLPAQRLEQASRALDVRKQKRDGSLWEIRHRYLPSCGGPPG